MTVQPTDEALAAYLLALRASAKLDVTVLARRVSLSAAQVNELENGRHSLFYNRSIRLQAARKIIAHLGGDLAHVQANNLDLKALESVPSLSACLGSDVPSASLPILISPDRPSLLSQPTKSDAPTLAPVHASRSPRFIFVGLTLVGVLAGMAYVASEQWFFNAPQSFQALGENGSLKTMGEVFSNPLAPETISGLKAKVDLPPLNLAAALLADAQPESSKIIVSENKASEVSSFADSCALSMGLAPVFQPAQARKPGDMVYVVSLVNQVLCVVDASGKPQVQRLEVGQSQSFYGQPPWQIVSSQLQQTQLYFQGWRVRLPADALDRIQLVELR